MRALLITAFLSGFIGAAADVDTCQTQTGGSCSSLNCYSYRNARCVGDRFCECDPPRTCNVNGECVAPGSCPKFTGGTCSYFGCDSVRNARCEGSWGSGYCMCGENQCAINGNCVDSPSAMMLYGNATTTILAQRPGEGEQVKQYLPALSCLALFSAAMGVAFMKHRLRKEEPLLLNFVEISD